MAKRKHFKSSMICSSDNYEMSIRVHKTLYMDKYEKQQIEIASCKAYIQFFDTKIILRTKVAITKARKDGFSIHFE